MLPMTNGNQHTIGAWDLHWKIHKLLETEHNQVVKAIDKWRGINHRLFIVIFKDININIHDKRKKTWNTPLVKESDLFVNVYYNINAVQWLMPIIHLTLHKLIATEGK